MISSVKAETQRDIRDAFQIDDLRVFRNADGLAYAIIGRNLENKVITDRWLGGFQTVDEFRAVIEYICERFEREAYRYWLADLRLLNTGFHHSADWLAKTVFPRTIAAGLVREAVVLPTDRNNPPEYDVFGSGSSALDKITDGRVRGFTNIVDAKAWLFDPGPG